MARPVNDEISRFIIEQVEDHPGDLAPLIVGHFGVTRATASNYIRRLVDAGMLQARGKTRSKSYSLKELDYAHGTEKITPDTQDDEVWRTRLLPHFSEIPPNVTAICAYGFTEMFNNVIDHSGSPTCQWLFRINAKNITMMIRDFGIGIFEKIQQDFGLADHRQALFELSKGKLTSDKSRHSGEGIFFTSRMFDYFSMTSMNIFYSRKMDDDNQWLIDWEPTSDRVQGTMVCMEIDMTSDTQMDTVFSAYEGDNQGFSKTTISLKLAKFAIDQLISRSQGKRLMARLDGFREVLLDFQGVEAIGQGFADEVFRVFAQDHPNVRLMPVRTNNAVGNMITRALRTQRDQTALSDSGELPF